MPAPLPHGINRHMLRAGVPSGLLVKKIQINGTRYCIYGHTVQEVLDNARVYEKMRGETPRIRRLSYLGVKPKRSAVKNSRGRRRD